jgi:hypothetical protein
MKSTKEEAISEIVTISYRIYHKAVTELSENPILGLKSSTTKRIATKVRLFIEKELKACDDWTKEEDES